MNTPTLTKKQQYWLGHHHAIEKFDGTLKQYAETHSLVLQDIYSWRSQLRQKGLLEIAKKPSHQQPPKFAKVQSSPLSTAGANFQFRLGNISITANTFPEPSWLATFINKIESSQ